MKIAFGKGIAELGDLAKNLFKLAIVIAVTLLVLDKFALKLTAGSAAQNATYDIITEVTGLVGWIGVIILVFIGVILYGYTHVFGTTSGRR